jgi:hypothetical protein
MKRNELVDKLVSEGLSEKTLSKLTDNQINILGSRMLGEQMKKGDVVVPTNTDPNKIKQLTAQGLDVALVNKPATEGEVTEELKGNQKKIDKNHNGKIDAQDFKILKGQKNKTCVHCGKEMSNCSCDDSHLGESKPSAGLSKEKKSEVVKKAKSGGDIGKKGKGFEKLANKAAKEYGSKEAGKKVAAAAMWKNIHESNSELNAKRNLHFELKEAGVSDVDLESKDINELAEKHSKNTNVKNAHEFYKRVNSKTMNIASKMNETKNWVNNLVEDKYFHNFTSKNEIMELIQTKLNETATMSRTKLPTFLTSKAIKSAGPATAPTKPVTKPDTPTKPRVNPDNPGISPAPAPQAESAPTTKPKPTTKPDIKPGKPRVNPENPGISPAPAPQAKHKVKK